MQQWSAAPLQHASQTTTFFPVRVRIGVPEGGFGEQLFGEQLNVMYGWLNLHAGRGNFAIHSAPNDLRAALGGDAALFYFTDIAAARAFVERFACGMTVVSHTGSEWRSS